MFPIDPVDWESVEASEYASRFLVSAEPAFFTGTDVGALLFVSAPDREVVPSDDFAGQGFFIGNLEETLLNELRRVFSPISEFTQTQTVPEYGWDEIQPSQARGNYATPEEARAAAERLVAQGVPVGVVIKPNGYWAVVVTSS